MSKRKYEVETLKQAVSAVKQGRLSVSKAAVEFNVPRKTVDNHVKGVYTRYQHGPDRMVTEEEETALVNYIKYMSGQGFPLTRTILRAYIISLCKSKGSGSLFNLEKGPSDNWFQEFVKRHPELTERESERYDRARSRMSNSTVMTQYFGLLNETVDRLQLRDQPHRIFNADETGWNGKEKSKQRVFGVKGQHTYQQNITSTNHITAHLCISADGRVLPSFVIFEKCLPHMPYKDGVPGQWLYGSSESGYMDSELFVLWFEHIFIKHCGKERPVLLVLDNHDSHVTLEVIKMAKENGVELLGLPAHTTHILQPLDVSVNGPLKQRFSAIATNLGFVNKQLVINKAKFPAVLSHAIDQVCSPAKIKGAFKKSGMYPIDQEAIDSSQLTPSFIKTSNTAPPQAPSLPQSLPSTSSASASDTPSPTTSMYTPSTSGTTCSTCGTFLGTNPLVEQGLVPESLSKLFQPVPAKPQGACSRKMVTEARVITSGQFYKSLLDKQTEATQRKEAVEKRKIERLERKKEKESEKERKISMKNGKNGKNGKKQTTKKTTMETITTIIESDAIDVDLGVCCMCDSRFPECESENVEWIECGQCESWYHQVCVGLCENESVDDVYFVCPKCCDTD